MERKSYPKQNTHTHTLGRKEALLRVAESHAKGLRKQATTGNITLDVRFFGKRRRDVGGRSLIRVIGAIV